MVKTIKPPSTGRKHVVKPIKHGPRVDLAPSPLHCTSLYFSSVLQCFWVCALWHAERFVVMAISVVIVASMRPPSRAQKYRLSINPDGHCGRDADELIMHCSHDDPT